MKKYTDKEMRAIMDSVDFPFGLSKTQTFRVVLWTIFKRKKVNYLCENIEAGFSLNEAFKKAVRTP